VAFLRVQKFLSIPYVIFDVITKTVGSNMNKIQFSTFTIIILAAIALTVCALYSPIAQAENLTPPWQLTITGLVENPLNLTLSDIRAMPQTSEFATIFCVDFPNTPVTSGNWTGVKLSYLLQEANVSDNVIKVAFYASDGYSTDLSIQTATQDNVILAYQIDGIPLTETLRLVVPGNWGYKWISNLSSIELVNYNYLGKWENKGYPDEAVITVNVPFSRVNPFTPPKLSQTQISPLLTPNSTTPSPTDSALNATTQLSPYPTSTPKPYATPNQTENQPASPSPSPTATSTGEPISSSAKPATTNSLPIVEIATATIITTVVVSVVVLKKSRSV
jgi:DMSO/TMAO reductase YedYZ molybdopterin-dependent catalytic subunit